jgi:uncharacterized membrane protein YjgN (DUF898 family)
VTEPPPPPPGQPPYGSYPPNQYGAPQYGFVAPEHPQATTVLILGILSLVVCSLAGPFAWTMGNRVLREIDASGGQLGGRSQTNAGRICGMVATILMGVGLLIAVGVIIIAVLGVATSSTG